MTITHDNSQNGSERITGTKSRRRFLQSTGAVGTLALAGCIGDEDAAEEIDDDSGVGGDDGGPAGSTGDDSGGSDDAEYDVRIGTSSGGTFDVGLAFERAVSQHSDLVNYSTIEAPGFVGTTYQMNEGVLDGGITDSNTMNKAMDGRDMFADDPIDTLPWQGFMAFPYSAYLMCREDTDIETFDDLAGKNVYPAEPGFSNRATALEVWQMPQVEHIYDEMNIMDMNVSDAPGAMEEGRIDASIAYGTPGVGNTGFVVEYDARVDVRYVEHTPELVEAIQEFSGAGYSEYDDAGEQFQWQQDIGTDEIVTWDLEVGYAFHPDTPDEAVYELLRVADEHGDTARESEMRFWPRDADDLAQWGIEDYPFHPGAASYLQDEGAWNDDWIVGDRDMVGEYN